jgi:hypothetical protein
VSGYNLGRTVGGLKVSCYSHKLDDAKAITRVALEGPRSILSQFTTINDIIMRQYNMLVSDSDTI